MPATARPADVSADVAAEVTATLVARSQREGRLSLTQLRASLPPMWPTTDRAVVLKALARLAAS